MDRKFNGNVANIGKDELEKMVTDEVKKSMESYTNGVNGEALSKLIKDQLDKVIDKQGTFIEKTIEYEAGINRMMGIMQNA